MAELVAGLVLIPGGCLACAYGALFFLAPGSSDSSTTALIQHGLMFAVPGAAAVVAGIWILRRSSPQD